MDPKTKVKLKEVLSKESERQRAVAEANTKRDAEERASADKETKAQQRWPAVQSDIRAAVDEVNQQIASAGLSLSISEGKKRDPAIAQLHITLTPQGTGNERQIVVNVNSDGTVVPVFQIPHTARPRNESFELAEANVNLWAALIVDFLDQALAYVDRKK
jgi:hypothetical protein